MFGFFKSVFSHIFGIFGDFFRSEAMKFVARNKAVFVGVILDIATSSLTGDDVRRGEAFARAKATLKEAGIEAKDSFINLAIEIIVTELKAQQRIP